jgi:hypothetical protein
MMEKISKTNFADQHVNSPLWRSSLVLIPYSPDNTALCSAPVDVKQDVPIRGLIGGLATASRKKAWWFGQPLRPYTRASQS